MGASKEVLVLRVLTRRSDDVSYFTNDHALELEGVREGTAGWWLRGSGDAHRDSDVRRVLTGTPRSALVGYDLILASPRAISIALALHPDEGPAIVAAHRRSVRAAVGYLEDRALVVRSRVGGRDDEDAAQWQGIVAFTHGVNRHGEPHLHDHVLVGARPLGADVVADGRSLRAHAPAADALYRASLRHEIRATTTLEVWHSFDGVEHVRGMDEGYRALWGGHHDTRGEKVLWRRDALVARWEADRTRFEAIGHVTPPTRDPQRVHEHSFRSQLDGLDTVARRNLVAAFANAATFGAEPSELERTVDDLYPSLRDGRGLREPRVGVREARMIGLVNERGERPIHARDMAQWSQRSTERSRERDGPSR